MDVPPAAERATDPERSRVAGASEGRVILVAIGIVVLIAAAVIKPWGASFAPPVVATVERTDSSPPAAAVDSLLPSLQTTARPGEPLNGPHGAVVRGGPLEPGTYTYGDVDGRGFGIRFSVPDGWSWDGSSLKTVSPSGDRVGDAVITFFTGDVQVYPDPCHWKGRPLGPPIGPDVAALMAALAAQPMRSATRPIDRGAGSLGPWDRWAGMAIEVTVPDDLSLAGCDEGQFREWILEPDRFFRTPRLALSVPGQHDYVWAVEIGRVRLVVDVITMPDTPSSARSEVEGILRSIVLGNEE